MKNATLITISLVSTTVITVSAAVAIAEPAAATTTRFPGIQNAIELAVATGYAQGVGDIDSGSDDVQDLAGAGAHIELQAGYRITPNLAIAAYGSITDHADGERLSGTRNDVLGVTAGVQAAWHFRPTTEVDPWIAVGAGARYLIVDEQSNNDRELFGIDAARVQAGVDFRVSRMFALGPVIGASVSKFVWDERMHDGWNEIEDREANVHFHAGLMGRFDAPLGQ